MAYINIAVVATSFIITFLLFFIKEKNRLLWIIKIYYVGMLVLEISSYYLAKKQINNHYIFNYYTIIEITLCSGYFYFLMKDGLKRKKETRYIIILSTISLLIILINILFIRRMDLSMTFMSVPLILYSFMTFYFMMDVEIHNKIYIMFVISNFLMHSVSLLVFALMEVIFTFDVRQQTTIFFIRSIVFLIAKAIILIPIILHYEKVFIKRINIK